MHYKCTYITPRLGAEIQPTFSSRKLGQCKLDQRDASGYNV